MLFTSGKCSCIAACRLFESTLLGKITILIEFTIIWELEFLIVCLFPFQLATYLQSPLVCSNKSMLIGGLFSFTVEDIVFESSLISKKSIGIFSQFTLSFIIQKFSFKIRSIFKHIKP